MRRQLSKEKEIAIQRITALFEEAKKRHAYAARYGKLVLLIARKYKIGLTREQKLLCCKNCHSILFLGKTARVRLSSGKLVRECLLCHTFWRMPYAHEQKLKKMLKNKKIVS